MDGTAPGDDRHPFHESLLAGKVAVITGGGTGLGKAIATHYARVGARVVLARRSLEHPEPAAAEIRAAGGKTLAVEWARYQIRVNAIAPGPFETQGPMEKLNFSAGDAVYERVRQDVPIKRLGQPREVAWLAACPASEYADFITGETIVIDGGTWLSKGYFPYFTPGVL